MITWKTEVNVFSSSKDIQELVDAENRSICGFEGFNGEGRLPVSEGFNKTYWLKNTY